MILEKNAVGFSVSKQFEDFIKMENIEVDAEFKNLSIKQKIQIRHERAMTAYEDELLSEWYKPCFSVV